MSSRTWIVAACMLAGTPAVAAQTLVKGPKVDTTGATAVAEPDDVRAADELWVDMGLALEGTHGAPVLTGSGALAADSAAEVRLDNAREYAPVVLVISGAFNPTAFKGGLLAPNPAILQLIRRTGGDGSVSIALEWDGDLPGGLDIYMQFVIQDPEAIGMYALSNVLATTTP